MEIEGVVDIKSPQTNSATWLSSSEGNGVMLPIWSDGTYAKFQLYLSASASEWDISTAESSGVLLSEGSIFKCVLRFTGTKYIYTLTNLTTGKVVKTLTSTSTKKVYQSPTRLGIKRNTHSMVSDNTIDLKAFSITVDGEEVFNGNKTGIDNIKADNYKIVGSPVISDDGIASGFNKSNYLIAPTKLNLLNSLFAECSFTYKNKDQESIIWCYNLNCYLSINKSGFFLKYPTGTSSESSTSTYLSIPLTDVSISEGDVVHSKVTLSPNKISITINNIVKELDVNINWGYLQRVTSLNGIRLGNANAFQENYYFAGSIDLNAFKIYVDGNLVYQPCLKIPYTQSKTGSKIVDGGYRDRVRDVYEQFGTASYYTLDRTSQNFTLPMSEIYGMINSIKSGHDVPIGMVFPMLCSSSYVPDGALPLSGAEYTKALFPNFYTNFLVAGLLNTCTYDEYASDITTYGQCVKFALDTENEKFKVPTIKDGSYLTQALSDTELGKVYKESLPNITATARFNDGPSKPIGLTSASGAIYGTDNRNVMTRSESGGNYPTTMHFDASRSSSTYQNNAPVQGDNVRVRYFVQVANGQINQSQMDWSAWASSLQGKVDKDSSWGMPDYSAGISVTYPLSSNPYTAPCNGMLCPWGKPSNTAINPIINGVKQEYLRLAELSGGSGGFQGRSYVLSKGDVIYFDTSYDRLDGCVFYPLKGAK